ncbi:hypothetical protein AFB00_29450 (plasmid) [Pseudonocardia sp. HH130630-07]|nr:hypothetical protein AFB00_29450 [Pseudonocardia sp. HH130630-07]
MTAVQHRRGAAARDRWSWLAWWLPVAAVTGLVAAAVAPDIAVLFGYRSLGPAAAIGQPLARTLAAGAASVAAAGLITAVIHAPGPGQGALSRTGYAAMRVVRPATAVFTVAAATIAVLTVAESTGLSPAALLSDPPTFLLGLVTVEAAAGWALAAVLLALVGVAAGTVLTWRGATWLFVLFLAGLVVPPATAVSNSERSHDWYGDAVTGHVVAATLWIGSAVAIWWLARPGPVGEIAWRRHGRLATGAALTLVLSGGVPFALDVGPDGLTSGYGLLVIGSSVMLVAALVAVGLWRGAPVRIRLAIELVLLTAAAAAGAVMTRLVPPQARVPEALDADRLVFLLGYELPDQLGWPELAGVWRIDRSSPRPPQWAWSSTCARSAACTDPVAPGRCTAPCCGSPDVSRCSWRPRQASAPTRPPSSASTCSDTRCCPPSLRYCSWGDIRSRSSVQARQPEWSTGSRL